MNDIDITHEIVQSVKDVQHRVKTIHYSQAEHDQTITVLNVATLEDKQLTIHHTMNQGFVVIGGEKREQFDTLHNLLMKLSPQYAQQFHNHLEQALLSRFSQEPDTLAPK